MVGLSVVLEGSVCSGSSKSSNCSTNLSQVVNKASMIITKTSSPTPSSPNPFSGRNNRCSLSSNTGFLDSCFLCKQELLPGKDIYMYKGDRAFCSEECRCRQMFMDEEETNITKIKNKKRDKFSLAAIKPPPHHQDASPSSPPPSCSSSSYSTRKGASKSANAFVF